MGYCFNKQCGSNSLWVFFKVFFLNTNLFWGSWEKIDYTRFTLSGVCLSASYGFLIICLFGFSG